MSDYIIPTGMTPGEQEIFRRQMMILEQLRTVARELMTLERMWDHSELRWQQLAQILGAQGLLSPDELSFFAPLALEVG